MSSERRGDNRLDETVAVPPRAVMKLALVVVAVLSCLAGIAVVEISYRVLAGLPVFSLADWRSEGVTVARFGDRAIYDPVLGWTLRSGFTSNGFNTLQHGIRRNFDEAHVRTGAVLAVGDSFTEGWDEVRDSETWPAHLDRLIGRPVVNAGVGGYATDQILLRAEKLLPVVKPEILVVGFNEIDIFRSGHAPFGGPKPYFTIENGNLRFHAPQPLDFGDHPSALAKLGQAVRGFLGHLAVADIILRRISLNYWYGDTRQVYRKVDTDEIAITCALLKRVKGVSDKQRVKMLLFMQYYGQFIQEEDSISDNAKKVHDCARNMDVEVVDQFESLREIAVAQPKAYREHYIIMDGQFQHMSSKGNAQAASLLASGLQ